MQTQNRVGQQFGNYELTQLIGSGGYAEVYLAKHTHIPNLQHAIKILTGTNLQAEQRESFIAEASTIANLQNLSTHIVQLHDFGIQTSGDVAEDGIPYIVMEYAAGGTLRKIYPSGTQVPLERIVFYTKQVAEALQCAHNQVPPIMHRDIKPENMLLRSRDHLLLSDFGIAVSGNTASHVITVKEKELVGTVTYMAPERFSKSTRRASDQYSLGIVVYEWLSGSPPFDGSDREVAYKQLVAAPPELSSQYPHITKEIEDVVMRALEKAPEDRFPTVKEFADALEKAVQSSLPRNQFTQQPAGNAGPLQSDKRTKVITSQIQPPLPSISSPLPTPSYPFAPHQSLPSSQSPLPSSSSPIPSYPFPLSSPEPSIQSPSSTPSHASALPQSQPLDIPDPQIQLPSPSFDYTGVTELMPPKQGLSSVSFPQSVAPPLPAAGLAQNIAPSLSVGSAQSVASSLPAAASSAPAWPSPVPSASWSSPAPSPTWSSHTPPSAWAPAPATHRNSRKRRNYFDFSTQLFWDSEAPFFVYGGLILNIVSAIGIGFLPYNIITLLEGLVFSLFMFMLCVCAVETITTIFFGILVAVYWLEVGRIIGDFITASLNLDQSQLSLAPDLTSSLNLDQSQLSLALGLVFFLVSLILHIRYALRKNP